MNAFTIVHYVALVLLAATAIMLYIRKIKDNRVLTKQKKLLETALSKSAEKEAYLKAIFNGAKGGFFIYSIKQKKLTYVNSVFEEMYSSVDCNIFNKPITELFHAEYRELVKSGLEKILNDPLQNFRAEVQLDPCGGEEKWVDLSLSPIIRINVSVNYLIGLAIDITDRKGVEQELIESRQIYHALVDNLNDVVAIVDADGKNLFMNKRGCKYHQVSPEKIVGTSTYDFYEEHIANKIVKVVKKAINQKPIGEEIIELQLHNQRYFVGLTAVPIHENDGSVKYAQTIGRNLTQEMTKISELNELNEVLKKIMGSLQSAIYCLRYNHSDKKLHYQYLSPGIEKLYGKPVSYFKNNPFGFFEMIHPDDMNKMAPDADKIITTEGKHVFQLSGFTG